MLRQARRRAVGSSSTLRALIALGLISALLAGLATGAASAAPSDFRITMKYRVTSNQLVGDQRFITLVGSGQAPELGRVDATSSVVVGPPVAGCAPRSADEEWSTATGTLRVHSEAQLCGGKLSGTWEVTGGDGAFASASGGGSLTSSRGNNVVIKYEGSLTP